MPKHIKAKHNKRKGRNRPKHRKRKGGSGQRRPTLVLRGHALINQNITGVNIKQINIAPSLGIFGADITQQAKFFQQYRIRKVNVRFLNLDNVVYQSGVNNIELITAYQVPMINASVPVASQAAYLAYKNVKFFSYRKDFSRSFTPFVNTAAGQNQVFLRAPRLPTTNLDIPHFGYSFLFVKLAATASVYDLRAVITADIQFYSYDGNNGVAYQPQNIYVTPSQFDSRQSPSCLKEQFNQKVKQQINLHRSDSSSSSSSSSSQYLEQIKKQVTQKFQISEPDDQQSITSFVTDLFRRLRATNSHSKSLRDIQLRTIQKNPGPRTPTWTQRQRFQSQRRLKRGQRISTALKKDIKMARLSFRRASHLRDLRATILDKVGLNQSTPTRIYNGYIWILNDWDVPQYRVETDIHIGRIQCLQDEISALQSESQKPA